MQQDLFGETLEKKILRMEKWIVRIQKEVWFLKEVHHLAAKKSIPEKKSETIDMFGT
jgi:hypothetical protein